MRNVSESTDGRSVGDATESTERRAGASRKRAARPAAPKATHFSNWLAKELADRQWTERELAERAAVSRAAVCRWLRGNRVPNPLSLPRLAEALSISWPTLAAVLARDGIVPIPLYPRSAPREVAPEVIPAGQDNFPNWLAGELERRGMSTSDLALRAGEEATVIDFWLRGFLVPSSNQVVALAAALSAA